MCLQGARPRKKVTLLFLLIFCINFRVSRVAPTPCFRRVTPPTYFKPARLRYSTVDPTAHVLLPELHRQKRRAGSRDTTGDPESICGAYKCQRRCAKDFILQRYIIKQVVAAIQGPKSKTHVLIVFKNIEGLNISFAYIKAIKHLKKRLYGRT